MSFYGLLAPKTAAEEKAAALPYPATMPPEGLGPLAQPTDAWQLTLSGDVLAEAKVVTLSALDNYAHVVQTRRLVSAQGWSYRARWQGWVLARLVRELNGGNEPMGAQWLIQKNAGGAVSVLPWQEVVQHEVLLASHHGLPHGSDTPLPPLYGGPLAVMVFHRYAHLGLGRITELSLVRELPEGLIAPDANAAAIQPGQYYAFDAGVLRPIREQGEVTGY